MLVSPANATPSLSACGLTHPGRQRGENEDAVGAFADARLFVVADGMGGYNAGEVASRIAVESIERFFRKYHADPTQPWPYAVDAELSLGANLLRVAVKVANDQIRAAIDRNGRQRMGATVVAMAIGQTQLAVAHAGDSRAYRLRGGELSRLTRDHSLMEELMAARPGITAEELTSFAHRNVVTKSLGSRDEVEPTLYVGTVEVGDLFLLCSDGLWGSVPDARIASLMSASPDLQRAGQLLIDGANEAGGPDNISVVLVRVG